MSMVTPRTQPSLMMPPPQPQHVDVVTSPRQAYRESLREASFAGASISAPLDLNGWTGRMVHIPRCPHHPEEPAEFFCATCECPCICAECVVNKDGIHRNHDVLRVGHAHDKLRARAGSLLDEAVRLEDEYAMVVDRLQWRRKDIERAAARGRASVRSAFERVRAQLNDREAELMESLDVYELESCTKLDSGNEEFAGRLEELRRLQEDLRSRCRSGADAVEALNTYAAAKKTIAELSKAALDDPDAGISENPEDFIGLAGSARAELDLHAEGLATLGKAVQGLTKNVELNNRGGSFTGR